MLIFVILLFFCISVNGSADEGSPTQWNEHTALCRSPVWYTVREDVETAQECKNICDKDHRCLMVKYSKERMKCWLCDNNSLTPSTKCLVKYDFFIKVDPIPSVLWLDKLNTCKQDKPYKIWFIETAQECKNTCAAEVECKMVKYSAEERKCFFSSSSELESSNKCMVEYDFYIKVSQTHAMKWIEHIKFCGNVDSYEVSSARTDEHCKYACARDSKCFMVMYDPKENYCWKSSSYIRHSRKCTSKLNFYQKDICATMKKECKDEELCINNGRNHSCLAECPQGYYEEYQACKDVNECSDKPGLCGKTGECFNTPGSYKCICGIGHEWNSEGCIDMNECSKTICGKHAVCRNTVGSYSCTCRFGFTKIGKKCVDVDECRMGLSICSKSAKCINTIGGYSCEDPHVDAGKQPVALSLAKNETQKKSWVDKLLERIETKWKHVDTVTEFPEVQTRYSTKYPPTMYTEYSEAKTTPNTQVLTMVAPVNGQTPTLMSGTPGKPRVLGTLAVEVTKMPEVVIKELWLSHPQLCVSVSHYENISHVESEKQCRWKCEQQTKCVMVQYDTKLKKCWLSDDRKITPKSGCNELFDYYIKGRNECKGKRGKCHHNAICRASKGRKVCQCVYGFEGDGWSCKDIDECSFYQNLCGNNGECVNTLGSYSCKCKRGFEHKDGECTKGGSSARDSSMNQWKRGHGAATSVNITSLWVLAVISLFACALSC